MTPFGTREGTVAILLMLVVIMLSGVVVVYRMHMPAEVCTTVLGAFTGAFSALLLALNGGVKQNPGAPNA